MIRVRIMKDAKFVLMATKFHGGGIISSHRSEVAAERAERRWKVTGCTCGCCRVIPIGRIDEYPFASDVTDPYTVCR